MSTQTISTTAEAARESARQDDGRFGAQARDEAGVVLDDRAASDWSYNGTLDDQSIIAACRRFAHRTGSRYGVDDREDLAQMTAEHFIRYVNNRREKVRTGQADPKPEFNYERHIGQISTGLGQRIASGLPNGGRDLTALTKYLKTREAFETKYGRQMTRVEEDELADKIRASFPPGKRPIDKFHRAISDKQIASLDAAREEGSFIEPSTADATPAPEAHASDEAAHDALDIIDAGGRGASTAAARNVWEVVASEHQAPSAVPNHLSTAQAKRVRDRMQAAGGISAVLARYGEGAETDEDMDALMAPFGGHGKNGADGAELVVATLERHPQFADGIWDKAVLAATVERKKAEK